MNSGSGRLVVGGAGGDGGAARMLRRRGHIVQQFAQMCRWRLGLAVTGTVLVATFLARPLFDLQLAVAALGAFFGSCGCSALNQLQDRRLDSLMTRTRHRPLVTGAVGQRGARATVLLCLAASWVLLYVAGGLAAVVVLLGIVVCYNGGYTCLKTSTPMHLIPGLVAGALPVTLGTICGGGDPLAAEPVALFALFVVWQVVHFRGLTERYGTEYRAAGVCLPPFFENPSAGKLFRLCCMALGGIMPLWAGIGLGKGLAVSGVLLVAMAGRSSFPRLPAAARWLTINLAISVGLGIVFIERYFWP